MVTTGTSPSTAKQENSTKTAWWLTLDTSNNSSTDGSTTRTSTKCCPLIPQPRTSHGGSSTKFPTAIKLSYRKATTTSHGMKKTMTKANKIKKKKITIIIT